MKKAILPLLVAALFLPKTVAAQLPERTKENVEHYKNRLYVVLCG